MKLRDVARLLNKTEHEVEEMLKSEDSIALDLRENTKTVKEDNFNIEAL